MLSDTRTNAGLDNVSTFGKMTVWEKPGDRVIALVAAGNLSISQSVINVLNERIEPKKGKSLGATLMTVSSMFQAAGLVGQAVREVYETDGKAMEAQDAGFNVSIILGGQIKGRELRLFQIYSAGNFIEATEETPFLQIGEHKYGKPILDRAVSYDMDLTSAVKLGLVSMDSTMRSNLSVGLPIDLLVYRRDALSVTLRRRIEASDLYYLDLCQRWSEALRKAYTAIPTPPWMEQDTRSEVA